MEDDRNPEAGLFDEELLQLVGELRHLHCVLATSGIAQPADLPQTVFELPPDSVEVQVPRLGIGQLRLLLPPHAKHLRNFLLKRHPREKIGHALLHRQCRVLVIGEFDMLQCVTAQQLLTHKDRGKEA